MIDVNWVFFWCVYLFFFWCRRVVVVWVFFVCVWRVGILLEWVGDQMG